jgi:hypothetical protein
MMNTELHDGRGGGYNILLLHPPDNTKGMEKGGGLKKNL